MATIKASNILIFGATGFIGKYITEKVITAQPAFNHITIFTSKETVERKGALLDGWAAKAGNVSVVAGSAESESDVRGAYRAHEIDTVICAFGRAAIAKQIDLLRWADQDGVAWFLPSEFGTDVEYGPASAGEKPHQQKLAVRRFIREEVRRTRVTYVVTGPYFESWVGRMPGLEGVCPGYDAERREALLAGDGEGRVGFTTMPDVGRLVVAALQHPEASVGRALKVNSFEVTPNQVLAAYEKLTGGARWAVSYVPVSKMVEAEERLWAEGNPKATVITLRRIWAEGGTLYEKTDNESIGLRPEDMGSMEDMVRELLAAKQ